MKLLSDIGNTFSANHQIADLSVSSLNIIDSLEAITTFIDTSLPTTSAKDSLESEGGDDATRSNTRLPTGVKQPVLAIGAVAKLTPTGTRERWDEEIQATLYYSLLIFASCEDFFTR